MLPLPVHSFSCSPIRSRIKIRAIQRSMGGRQVRSARQAGEVRERVATGITCSRTQCLLDTQQLVVRSEEHTSELQSLMRISYAVFCLKKKKHPPLNIKHRTSLH